jgi:hypothetical protein
MVRTRSVSRLTALLVKAAVIATLAAMLSQAAQRVCSAAGRAEVSVSLLGR